MNQDYINTSVASYDSTRRNDWAGIETPLTGFTDCHAGILGRLEAFKDLPALIAAADRARVVANDTVALFEHAVMAHHGDEESELFPAVLRWASEGEEHTRVKAMVQRLTSEHRTIERLWKRHRSDVEAAARGKPSNLQKDSADQLVQAYRQHAIFEEEEFLPLARNILQRDSAHMAALGLSLHMRHAPIIPGYV
jgi:hypothetical protein